MNQCLVVHPTSANSRPRRISTSYWRTVLFSGFALAFLVQSTNRAVAQFGQPAPGISVEGTGEARTVPDVVEINLRLVARGELTDDAVVKHRDARKRTLETFQSLRLDNLKLEEKDLTLRPGNAQEMMQMMWNGMMASSNKRTQIEVGSMLRARLSNVGKVPTEELMSTIGKLLDAAQDSGAGLGVSDNDMMMMRWYGYGRQTPPLVKFVVTNLGEIREKAYEAAVADARKRAERLARLNGVKLGLVAAIEETDSTSRMFNGGYNNPLGSDDSNDNTELIADTLTGGRITIRLRVRFAIDGQNAATAAVSTERNDTRSVSIRDSETKPTADAAVSTEQNDTPAVAKGNSP